jgi:hypothetical protein
MFLVKYAGWKFDYLHNAFLYKSDFKPYSNSKSEFPSVVQCGKDVNG